MSVSPADIATDLGMAAPATGSIQWNQWDMWISEARMLIEAGPDGHPGLVLADLDQTHLDYVVRKAVRAAALSDAVAVDENGNPVSRASTSGRIVITDDWWGLLSPSVGETGSFSVSPYFEADDVLVWPYA